MIIDDERHVRRAIRILGKWDKYGIDTVFEAVNGREGLLLLKEHKPDIVLVDMKMPEVNGVEFLQAASKEHAGARYIVISGFNDFEYTKQAIKSKVLDYLLKPVVGSDLNECLAKAVKELNEENEKKNREMSRGIAENLSLPLVKEKFFTALISNAGTTGIINEYKKLANVENQDVLYGIALIRIINFNEICSTKYNNDSNSIYFSAINAIDELCSEWCRSFSFKSGLTEYEIIVVLEAPAALGDNLEETTARGLRRINATLERLFGLYSIAGFGDYIPDIKSLHDSFSRAEERLNSVNLLDNSQSVFTGLSNKNPSEKVAISNKKEMLFKALESGSIEYTRRVIREYFEEIKRAGCFTIEDAHNSAAEFVFMLNDIKTQLGIFDNEHTRQSLRQEYIHLALNKFEDFSEFVLSKIEKVFDVMRNGLKNSEKASIYSIREYIDNNYFKEIKLTVFSEKYFLSKEHLCRMFKDTFGCGIYEYAMKVRMEKAKQMLDEPDIRIQHVSDTLGFNDSNYFSKAFKKYYGISPSEYRASHSNR